MKYTLDWMYKTQNRAVLRHDNGEYHQIRLDMLLHMCPLIQVGDRGIFTNVKGTLKFILETEDQDGEGSIQPAEATYLCFPVYEKHSSEVDDISP